MGDEISLAEELRRRQERSQRQHGTEGPPAGRDWRGRDEEPSAPGAGGLAEEPEVNCAAYGFRRGVRERATYCEFQKLNGDWLAPGYAWLPCPVWAPSRAGQGRGQAVVLAYVTGLKITLRGRNLRPLYERLLRQQVYRVSEMGEEADQFLPEEATVVYAIEVEEPEGQKR